MGKYPPQAGDGADVNLVSGSGAARETSFLRKKHVILGGSGTRH